MAYQNSCNISDGFTCECFPAQSLFIPPHAERKHEAELRSSNPAVWIQSSTLKEQVSKVFESTKVVLLAAQGQCHPVPGAAVAWVLLNTRPPLFPAGF